MSKRMIQVAVATHYREPEHIVLVRTKSIKSIEPPLVTHGSDRGRRFKKITDPRYTVTWKIGRKIHRGYATCEELARASFNVSDPDEVLRDFKPKVSRRP